MRLETEAPCSRASRLSFATSTISEPTNIWRHVNILFSLSALHHIIQNSTSRHQQTHRLKEAPSLSSTFSNSLRNHKHQDSRENCIYIHIPPLTQSPRCWHFSSEEPQTFDSVLPPVLTSSSKGQASHPRSGTVRDSLRDTHLLIIVEHQWPCYRKYAARVLINQIA